MIYKIYSFIYPFDLLTLLSATDAHSKQFSLLPNMNGTIPFAVLKNDNNFACYFALFCEIRSCGLLLILKISFSYKLFTITFLRVQLCP